VFEIDFDFIDHALLIRVSDGTERLPLQAQSVANFLRLGKVGARRAQSQGSNSRRA
jgi:hypothetical protein